MESNFERYSRMPIFHHHFYLDYTFVVVLFLPNTFAAGAPAEWWTHLFVLLFLPRRYNICRQCISRMINHCGNSIKWFCSFMDEFRKLYNFPNMDFRNLILRHFNYELSTIHAINSVYLNWSQLDFQIDFSFRMEGDFLALIEMNKATNIPLFNWLNFPQISSMPADKSDSMKEAYKKGVLSAINTHIALRSWIFPHMKLQCVHKACAIKCSRE